VTEVNHVKQVLAQPTSVPELVVVQNVLILELHYEFVPVKQVLQVEGSNWARVPIHGRQESCRGEMGLLL